MTSSTETGQRRYDPLTGEHDPSGEYRVVQLRLSWGLLSIFIFAFSLPIRYWLHFLPWHPYQYWYRPGYMVLATLGLSTVGMIVAWLGLRAARRDPSGKEIGRGASRLGLFLNGTVFSILVLAVGFIVVYWRFFR